MSDEATFWRVEAERHDPETCRDGDHYGQCSGVTAPHFDKKASRSEAEMERAVNAALTLFLTGKKTDPR